MNKEEEFIKALKNPEGDTSKYFAIDLLTEQYDSQRLIEAARKHDMVHPLGYLVESTYEAAKLRGVQTLHLQELMREMIPHQSAAWRYLSHDLPAWGEALLSEGPQTSLNQKWHIYSRLQPPEIAEWIDLYILKEHASTPRR